MGHNHKLVAPGNNKYCVCGQIGMTKGGNYCECALDNILTHTGKIDMVMS